MRFNVCVLLLTSAFLSSCAATHVPPSSSPPAVTGAASFDQRTYDTLITVQAALETASSRISSYPQFKPQLNHAIDLYNAAEQSYKLFHASLSAGPADIADLSQRLVDLTAAVAAIVKSFGAAPAPLVKPAALLYRGQPAWRLG